MIWHSEIQDWIIFKAQVQQDFGAFGDEMNKTSKGYPGIQANLEHY